MNLRIPTCKIYADEHMLKSLKKYGIAYVIRKRRKYIGRCALINNGYIAIVDVGEVMEFHGTKEIIRATREYYKYSGFDSWEEWYEEVRAKNPGTYGLFMYVVKLCTWLEKDID